MRWNRIATLIALAMLASAALPCHAAGFGTVTAIGGLAADMALDEGRAVVYIANFTANRIDVMSTTTNTVQTSMNVSPQPGSLALSADGQYLLIAHFGNTTPANPSRNLLTLIRLTDNTRQTFITGDPPLGVAFFNNQSSGPGQALVVTTTGFFTLDPTNGVLSGVTTFANLAQTTPVPNPTFPGQIIETALTTSGDKFSISGVAGAGTGTQFLYHFDSRNGYNSLPLIAGWITSPALLPRVSVNYDGSYAMIGWAMYSAGGVLTARYPKVLSSTNVTGHAFDSKNNLIYAQIPDANQPVGPPYSGPLAAGAAAPPVPTLLLMDSDNLTVRDRIRIPENMVGRAVLNSAATVLYAISDSGVMTLPVGSLNQFHRVAAAQEDILVQTNFCNRASVAQNLTITDPGGGHTDFSISSNYSGGVMISPSSGTTPATVQVLVDPRAFQTLGTTVVTLTVNSNSAINIPKTVRLLVNNPDQNQRGSIVDVPGVLSDILPDPARNRYYVLRQDVNQLLVFDASTNQKISALRTATTPNMMAFTMDQKYLLVANDDSQLVTVYDLDKLQQMPPVVLPGGHYGRSLAASNSALLALVRDENNASAGAVDTINFAFRTASKLSSLGVFENTTSPTAVLAPSPNGRTVLLAAPDGSMMLYAADGDTWMARKDLPALSGGFAASAFDTYVIGNNVFNASLVPVGTMDASLGTTAGFAFMGQGGYRVTASAAASAGAIQNMPALLGGSVKPVPMTEAPLLPAKSQSFTRTLAPLPSAGTVVTLTVSGVTVLSGNYDAATAPPAITKVVSAADFSPAVAPGGIITIFGQQMSPVNAATSQIPLPTALGEMCLAVNGAPIPLIYVSNTQVNAQLPFGVIGNASMAIHSPAGISNNLNFTVQGSAPTIFMSGTAGPETGLPTVFRYANGQLVTPTNPVNFNDLLVFYVTGLGAVTPAVPEGLAAPLSPLSWVNSIPSVTLGGVPLDVQYAGLVPTSVSGLYQINAVVPASGVPQGLSIPLTISQGGSSTTLNVRVVKQ
jgi:uncharacterized protein (TIGR03437 family)